MSTAPARSAWSAHAATSWAILPLKPRNTPPKIQPQVERDLLVARPARVESPAGVANALDEFPFDEAVNVFVRTGHKSLVAAPFFENGFQRGHDRRRVCRVHHGGSAERLGPRDAAGDVVFEERAIEAKRDAEIKRRRVGRAVEPA